MQTIPYVEAVDDSPKASGDSTLGLAELLLKDPLRVDHLTREESRLVDLIPRFLGLALPFVAELWCVRSIHRVFLALVVTIPEEQRDGRALFLRRLTLAWAAFYTAVTPVMIWTLWNTISERLK